VDAKLAMVEDINKKGGVLAAVRDALEKVRFEDLLGNIAPGPNDHFEGACDTSILGMLKNGQFVPYVK
jgi:hypothetical protein